MRMRMGKVKAETIVRGMAPKETCTSFVGQPRRGGCGYAFQNVTRNHVTHTAEEPRQRDRHATKIHPPTTDDLRI